MGRTLRKWVDPVGSKKKGKEELKSKEEKVLQQTQAAVAAAEQEVEREKMVFDEKETLRRRAAYATSIYRFSRGEKNQRVATIKRKTLLG